VYSTQLELVVRLTNEIGTGVFALAKQALSVTAWTIFDCCKYNKPNATDFLPTSTVH
jgi:hypothetical protein